MIIIVQEPIACGRECVAENETEEAKLQCLQYLKEWCLACEGEDYRSGHMNWGRHPRYVVSAPAAATLEQRGGR